MSFYIKYFILVALLALICLTSCAPQTKNDYLDQYVEFIEQVGKDRLQFKSEDWETTNKEFKKFNEEYYAKFKDELTWKDQVILTKLRAKYSLYSSSSQISDVVKDLFNDDDLKKLKDEVKYYTDNDLHDDLQFLIDQAKDLGHDAEESLKQVLEELEINIEEFKNE